MIFAVLGHNNFVEIEILDKIEALFDVTGLIEATKRAAAHVLKRCFTFNYAHARMRIRDIFLRQ